MTSSPSYYDWFDLVLDLHYDFSSATRILSTCCTSSTRVPSVCLESRYMVYHGFTHRVGSTPQDLCRSRVPGMEVSTSPRECSSKESSEEVWTEVGFVVDGVRRRIESR